MVWIRVDSTEEGCNVWKATRWSIIYSCRDVPLVMNALFSGLSQRLRWFFSRCLHAHAFIVQYPLLPVWHIGVLLVKGLTKESLNS
jgi:hypothetical protein